MNDSLQYISRDPMYRSHHEGELSFSFVYAFSENYVLPISHDEVVHGKGSLFARMPGDHWQKLANMRAFLAYMWGHPGKQLLFMGQEFGQLSEWAEGRGLDWWILDQPSHAAAARLRRDAQPRLPGRTPRCGRATATARRSRGSARPTWNPNVIAFSRRDWHGNTVVVVCNFSGVPVHGLRARPARVGRLARDPQLATRRRTAARASATSASCTPASPAARRWCCRRSACCGCGTTRRRTCPSQASTDRLLLP